MLTVELFTVKTGSQSYGLALPGSDDDQLRVYVGHPTYYVGVSNLSDKGVEQRQKTHEDGSRTDYTYYELRRWLAQGAAGSAAVLQVLFTDVDRFVNLSSEGLRLLTQRHLFVTQKVVRSFGGNANNEWACWLADPTQTKKAMNAMRLWTCGAELLNTGRMATNRTNLDAQKLLGVRTGKFNYDSVYVMGTVALERFDTAVANTTLPEEVDMEKVNDLCWNVTRNTWSVAGWW